MANLIIGLGGVGTSIVYEYYQKAEDHLGDADLEILAIDSEFANKSEVNQFLDDQNCFVCVGGMEINQAIYDTWSNNGTTPFSDFYYPGYKIPNGHMGNGCGAVRFNGKICSFAHCYTDGLLVKMLKDKINRLVSYGGKDSKNSAINVHIVGSFVGGTATGLFLDVAQMLRHFATKDIDMFGYFISPHHDYLEKKAVQPYVKAYAALAELNYWKSPAAESYYLNIDGKSVELKQNDAYPFKYVTILDGTSESGQKVPDGQFRDVFLPLVADYLFNITLDSAGADSFQTKSPNRAEEINEAQKSALKRGYSFTKPFLGSFGVSMIKYDKKSVDDYLKNMATRIILTNYFRSPQLVADLESKLSELENQGADFLVLDKVEAALAQKLPSQPTAFQEDKDWVKNPDAALNKLTTVIKSKVSLLGGFYDKMVDAQELGCRRYIMGQLFEILNEDRADNFALMVQFVERLRQKFNVENEDAMLRFLGLSDLGALEQIKNPPRTSWFADLQTEEIKGLQLTKRRLEEATAGRTIKDFFSSVTTEQAAAVNLIRQEAKKIFSARKDWVLKWAKYKYVLHVSQFLRKISKALIFVQDDVIGAICDNLGVQGGFAGANTIFLEKNGSVIHRVMGDPKYLEGKIDAAGVRFRDDFAAAVLNAEHGVVALFQEALEKLLLVDIDSKKGAFSPASGGVVKSLNDLRLEDSRRWRDSLTQAMDMVWQQVAADKVKTPDNVFAALAEEAKLDAQQDYAAGKLSQGAKSVASRLQKKGQTDEAVKTAVVKEMQREKFVRRLKQLLENTDVWAKINRSQVKSRGTHWAGDSLLLKYKNSDCVVVLGDLFPGKDLTEILGASATIEAKDSDDDDRIVCTKTTEYFMPADLEWLKQARSLYHAYYPPVSEGESEIEVTPIHTDIRFESSSRFKLKKRFAVPDLMPEDDAEDDAHLLFLVLENDGYIEPLGGAKSFRKEGVLKPPYVAKGKNEKFVLDKTIIGKQYRLGSLVGLEERNLTGGRAAAIKQFIGPELKPYRQAYLGKWLAENWTGQATVEKARVLKEVELQLQKELAVRPGVKDEYIDCMREELKLVTDALAELGRGIDPFRFR